MALEIHQFTYGSDNFGVLIHAPGTGETASIDAGDAQAVLDALAATGWTLSHLLVTHHDGDHTAGIMEVKVKTGCTVIGPRPVRHPIDGLDKHVGSGDVIDFGGQKIEVIETPGHTLDMINFFLPEEKVAFVGDTLFSIGCGRVKEGDLPMMWNSLQKLMALPPETEIYCGHEYTIANAKFALTVDGGNSDLIARFEEVKKLRSEGRASVPSTLALELKANPFLRADDSRIRKNLGMESASDGEVFAALRRRKDAF